MLQSFLLARLFENMNARKYDSGDVYLIMQAQGYVKEGVVGQMKTIFYTFADFEATFHMYAYE